MASLAVPIGMRFSMPDDQNRVRVSVWHPKDVEGGSMSSDNLVNLGEVDKSWSTDVS